MSMRRNNATLRDGSYVLAGARRVIDRIDCEYQPTTQLIHYQSEGIEEPDAEVIVHLTRRDDPHGFGPFLYLWEDRIWHSSVDFDRVVDSIGMILLTLSDI